MQGKSLFVGAPFCLLIFLFELVPSVSSKAETLSRRKSVPFKEFLGTFNYMLFSCVFNNKLMFYSFI